MKLKTVIYQPVAEVEVSEEEVSALLLASEHHYDAVCREASMPGGVLFGMRNRLAAGVALVTLTSRDLNVIAKIAEMLAYSTSVKTELAARLWIGCESPSGILHKLHDEYRRLNDGEATGNANRV